MLWRPSTQMTPIANDVYSVKNMISNFAFADVQSW